MKLREIERLRGAAIAMVLLMHWAFVQQLFPSIARSPWSGVDLFFVISGYVVTRSLLRLLPPLEGEATFASAFERSKAALAAFFARRFFRLVPAVLVMLLGHRYLVGLDPTIFGSARTWLDEVVAFFGGIYNYFVPLANRPGVVVLWSLSVEEHFYLLLPVVFVALRTTSSRLAGCAAIAFFSVVARGFDSALVRWREHADAVVGNPLFYDKFSSHLRFDSLMAGVAIALVLPPRRSAAEPLVPKPLMRFAVLPACLLLVACLPAAAPDTVLQAPTFIALWMISGVLVAFASMDGGYVLSFPVVAPALEYLGARSYALYLTHLDVARLDDFARKKWAAYARAVPDEPLTYRRVLVVLVAALLVAEALHRCVERPFMAYGRKLTDPERRGRPVPLGPRLRFGLIGAAAAVCLFAVHHRLLRAVGGPDLALHREVRASSSAFEGAANAAALTNGILEEASGLQTKAEDRPWAEIDLGAPRRIGSIRIYNCPEGTEGGILPLDVSLSEDGTQYDGISHVEGLFTQDWPWRVHVRGRVARYVRLAVPKDASVLCLSEVEIYSGDLMAALP